MSSAPDPSLRRHITWAIWMVVLAGLLLWVLYQVRSVLLLIYVSAVFAVGLSPLVRYIERKRFYKGATRVSRPFAIAVLYLLLLAVLAFIASMGLPPLIEQATALVQNAPAIFERVQDLALRYELIDRPYTLQELLHGAPLPGDQAVARVTQAVGGVIGGVVSLASIAILTFYFLLDAEGLVEAALRFFPREKRPWIQRLWHAITVKVGAWLMGQLLLGLIIAVSAGIGLWLLGVPYVLVLALVAAFGELIPVIGPMLAAIPAVAVALTVSPSTALATTVFFIVQQQIENNILVPKVMEKQVGVSAVTVMIAMMIGASLLGIAGALLAVPTAAVVQVLTRELLQHADEAHDEA